MAKGQSKLGQPGLILASGSPRRRELLSALGLIFEVVISHVPEIHKKGERADQFAKRIALEKAMSVKTDPGTIVLGADTIVVLDGQIYGKPADQREASLFLKELSGRTHQVITGYAILQSPDKIRVNKACQSEVTFKPLTQDVIDEYVATGEPLDKAGAYAAQGKGRELIEKITGSEKNVIGLPVEELIPWFEKLGIMTR